jgi:hypothetical protein
MLPDCDNNWAIRKLAPPKLWLSLQALAVSSAVDLDVQIADFLAQSIAIDTKKVSRADLVAPGCGQRSGDQRAFDLAQNAVI